MTKFIGLICRFFYERSFIKNGQRINAAIKKIVPHYGVTSAIIMYTVDGNEYEKTIAAPWANVGDIIQISYKTKNPKKIYEGSFTSVRSYIIYFLIIIAMIVVIETGWLNAQFSG